MIERVLGDTTGTKRTALLGLCAATSWGFGITALVAGWQVGLAVFALGLVAIALVRRGAPRPAPVRAPAGTADVPAGADDAEDGAAVPSAADLATAEERVLARLRAMQAEPMAEQVDPG